jgi:two-component system CheB/CheR fusion protein
MHGGTVAAFSAGPGQGSEFVVRLPAAGEPPDDGAPAPRGPTPGARRRLRVLVTDDNTDNADSLALLLRLAGHEVRVAHDGPAALAEAHAYHPEAIVLDIGLPGMDGFEVARLLRRQPGTERALLVALTGFGHEEDRRRGREAGIDHYLIKPAPLEELQGLLTAQTA